MGVILKSVLWQTDSNDTVLFLYIMLYTVDLILTCGNISGLLFIC